MAEGYEPRPFSNYVENALTKIDANNYVQAVYASRVIKYNDIKLMTIAVEINCPAFSSYYELFSMPSDCIPIFTASVMAITKNGNYVQVAVDANGKVKIIYNPALQNDLISVTLIYI